MNTKPFPITILAVMIILLAGCATGPDGSQDSAKYSIKNTEIFTHLDKTTRELVSCTNLQERRLPDGRLEVVAGLRNRGDRALKVQINCVFKDSQGFSTGDETAFQTVAVAAEATEAVRFTAADTKAMRFTLRVRMAR